MVEAMLMTGLLLLGSMTDVTCVMMISISMFIVIIIMMKMMIISRACLAVRFTFPEVRIREGTESGLMIITNQHHHLVC